MKNKKNTLDHKQVERRARGAYSMVVCVWRRWWPA